MIRITRTVRTRRCLVLLPRVLPRHGVPLSPTQPMRRISPRMMPPAGQIASPWARDIPVRRRGRASWQAIPGSGIKRPG
jgi:hypothetical protein